MASQKMILNTLRFESIISMAVRSKTIANSSMATLTAKPSSRSSAGIEIVNAGGLLERQGWLDLLVNLEIVFRRYLVSRCAAEEFNVIMHPIYFSYLSLPKKRKQTLPYFIQECCPTSLSNNFDRGRGRRKSHNKVKTRPHTRGHLSTANYCEIPKAPSRHIPWHLKYWA